VAMMARCRAEIARVAVAGPVSRVRIPMVQGRLPGWQFSSAVAVELCGGAALGAVLWERLPAG
jgi:hypothetical protein